jgi:hypothetical protein
LTREYEQNEAGGEFKLELKSLAVEVRKRAGVIRK